MEKVIAEILKDKMFKEIKELIDSSRKVFIGIWVRRFYTLFPIWSTMLTELAWSHYLELLKVKDKDIRNFTPRKQYLFFKIFTTFIDERRIRKRNRKSYQLV